MSKHRALHPAPLSRCQRSDSIEPNVDARVDWAMPVEPAEAGAPRLRVSNDSKPSTSWQRQFVRMPRYGDDRC